MEVGPRDLAEGNVVVAQRLFQDEKETIAVADFVAGIPARLQRYHELLLQRATDFREANTKPVDTWDEFVEQVKVGWASVLYDGTEATEQKIKEATSATPRCIPSEYPSEEGACFVTGAPSAFGKRVIFGRAY